MSHANANMDANTAVANNTATDADERPTGDDARWAELHIAARLIHIEARDRARRERFAQAAGGARVIGLAALIVLLLGCLFVVALIIAAAFALDG